MISTFIFFTKCQYLVSRAIDNEPIIYKINDTIYFDSQNLSLLKGTNNKYGFNVIKEKTDGFVIEKNQIFINYDFNYYVYKNDTLTQIEYDTSIEGIKPNEHYYLDSNIYEFE